MTIKGDDSGSYPDIAADWTQLLPNHDDIDGYHVTSGTSFATPRTAGILSEVLEDLRSKAGDSRSGASGTGMAHSYCQPTGLDPSKILISEKR